MKEFCKEFNDPKNGEPSGNAYPLHTKRYCTYWFV